MVGRNGWQAVASCQCEKLIAETARLRTRRHDQATIRLAGKCNDRSLHLDGVTDVNRTQLDPKRRRHRLDSAEHADLRSDGGVTDDSDARDHGRDLLEQLQPLPTKTKFG